MANEQIMTTIAGRLQAVRTRIQRAAVEAGRHENAVTLVAVSKAQSADSIRQAYLSGQRQFGENYLQEALDKQSELADLAIEWHFIGPIQSNKTQAIAQHFAWVHGVDRLKIAERLSQARPGHLPPLQICIQINVSNESSKSGASPQEVDALVDAIAKLPGLRLRGLMAIPAPTQEIALQQKQFRMLREIYESLRARGYLLDTLSMGMSDDFPAAINEGATIVRIGSAIFGARTKTEK